MIAKPRLLLLLLKLCHHQGGAADQDEDAKWQLHKAEHADAPAGCSPASAGIGPDTSAIYMKPPVSPDIPGSAVSDMANFLLDASFSSSFRSFSWLRNPAAEGRALPLDFYKKI